jgi:hypothetical protein
MGIANSMIIKHSRPCYYPEPPIGAAGKFWEGLKSFNATKTWTLRLRLRMTGFLGLVILKLDDMLLPELMMDKMRMRQDWENI